MRLSVPSHASPSAVVMHPTWAALCGQVDHHGQCYFWRRTAGMRFDSAHSCVWRPEEKLPGQSNRED